MKADNKKCKIEAQNKGLLLKTQNGETFEKFSD